MKKFKNNLIRLRAKFDQITCKFTIVDGKDLKLAVQKQENYLNSLVGTNSGTIVAFDKKKGSGLAA